MYVIKEAVMNCVGGLESRGLQGENALNNTRSKEL